MASTLQISARLGLSQNLPTGATYDILMVQTPNFPEGKITFTYTTPSGDIIPAVNDPFNGTQGYTIQGQASASITGIQKCAQFFLKCLFTNKGSDIVNPLYGTNMAALMFGFNANLTSPELSSTITNSIKDAVNQCKALLNDSSNDVSSMLSNVSVVSLSSPNAESFALTIQLTTLAGETGLISIPQPTFGYPLATG